MEIAPGVGDEAAAQESAPKVCRRAALLGHELGRDAQLEASRGGALTLIHAHGDNADLVRSYAGLFKGPVALTTQSVPRDIVYDFGGFTDGDRAVCFVRHFGCRRILLPGFDYSTPYPKPGSDVAAKACKLRWAKEIIEGMNPPGVELVRRCHAFIR